MAPICNVTKGREEVAAPGSFQAWSQLLRGACVMAEQAQSSWIQVGTARNRPRASSQIPSSLHSQSVAATLPRSLAASGPSVSRTAWEPGTLPSRPLVD